MVGAAELGGCGAVDVGSGAGDVVVEALFWSDDDEATGDGGVASGDAGPWEGEVRPAAFAPGEVGLHEPPSLPPQVLTGPHAASPATVSAPAATVVTILILVDFMTPPRLLREQS